MRTALIIPTYNASEKFREILSAIYSQSHKFSRVLVIDSTSSDSSPGIAQEFGATVSVIPKKAFSHGATRQLGVDLLSDAEIIAFMTQDALLASSDSLHYMLEAFCDPTVGAAYGRQLPSADASPVAAHARLYNYPAVSIVRSKGHIRQFGIRAAFISNSLAAYRRAALQEVGGFLSDVIFGEDTCVAAKMLLADWKIAYCAEATVYHSHNYGCMEELNRCFDIGVMHSRESWFINLLGKPEGEGKKFVLSELCYLKKNAPFFLPSAILRTLLKLTGYRLGLAESIIPIFIKKKLSMNKGYWNRVGGKSLSMTTL